MTEQEALVIINNVVIKTEELIKELQGIQSEKPDRTKERQSQIETFEKEVEAYEVAIGAIKEIQLYKETGHTPTMVKDLIEMNQKNHKNALENAHIVDELREIGTIEEFRTLKEKSTPKKPIMKYGRTYTCPPDCGGADFDEYGYIPYCPNCDEELDETTEICRCGQFIDMT